MAAWPQKPLAELHADPFDIDYYEKGLYRTFARADPTEVLPLAREAWARGGWLRRETVLGYLMGHKPLEAVDLVWRGLQSTDENVRNVAIMAAESYVRAGVSIPRRSQNRLLKLAKGPGRWLWRSAALDVLNQADLPGIEDLLKEFAARDESVEMRFHTNLRLLHRGYDVKAALLADLDGHDRDSGCPGCTLWYKRSVLGLSGDEEALIRERVIADMEETRQVLRARGSEHWLNRYPSSALSLFSFIKEGLPYTEEDIDFLARAARQQFYVKDKVKAVKALGWFNNDYARRKLKSLTRSNHPATVRREARKQLALTESPPSTPPPRKGR